MASRSCLSARVRVRLNLWRLWIDGTRPPEPVEIAGGDAEHPATATSRDRLVFSRYDWEWHLYRFAPGAARTDRGIVFLRMRSAFLARRPSYRVYLGPLWPHRDLGGRSRRIPSASAHVSSMGMAGIAQLVAGWPHARVRRGRSRWPRPCVDHSRRRRYAAPDLEPTGDQTIPTWSRDGQWIYFSDARRRTRHLAGAAAGGPAERTHPNGHGISCI